MIRKEKTRKSDEMKRGRCTEGKREEKEGYKKYTLQKKKADPLGK